MQAHELGFMSSWRMLTSEKGWIKPVLVLTLVAWIPIVGQIALLGYALEWARLTAWGMNTAPKQHGIDYGKMLTTGGRAFCVTFLLNALVALLLQVVFPGSLLWLITGGSVGVGAAGMFSFFGLAYVILMVLMALSGTFVYAAALRATLYDSFEAGWRLDRLFQMIGRDFGGFLKTYLVALIGMVVQAVYGMVMSFLGTLMLAGAAIGVAGLSGISVGHISGWQGLGDAFFGIGAGAALIVALVVAAVAFAGALLGTAMNLVAINAVGQWFSRFAVNRWGTSDAPLPHDAPIASAAHGSVPVNPVETAAASDCGAGTVSAHREPAASVPDESVLATHVVSADADPNAGAEEIEPVMPLDAEPAEEPCARVEDDAAKKPIPLGPVTSSDDESEGEEPIRV